MKRLKQDDNKDKQSPERKPGYREEVLSSKSFFGSIQFICFNCKQKRRSINNSHTTDFPSAIFRPPGA
ncbi:MAG: hypothetical protein K2Q21_14320 [Chitinophagaceae bacterium]|nr:hypothetical protein [Chitinophagaceae bacterium]